MTWEFPKAYPKQVTSRSSWTRRNRFRSINLAVRPAAPRLRTKRNLRQIPRNMARGGFGSSRSRGFRRGGSFRSRGGGYRGRGRGRGGSNTSTTVPTRDEEGNQLAERFEQVRLSDEVDEKIGFPKIQEGSRREGWLINMHPVRTPS